MIATEDVPLSPMAVSNSSGSSRVLVVGLCCVDVVNYVDKFPAEDSDTRVQEQRICLGGNAANNATVLSQLAGRHNCELFASLPTGNVLLDSLLTQCEVPVGRSVRRPPGAEVPMSTVVVNRTTGTRTILHYRGNLPELTAEEFCAAFGQCLHQFGWVHFEGRNFDQVRQMMQFVRSRRADGLLPRISVELEKIRPFPCLEQLIPLAELIFVSKDFAKSKGWPSMEAAIEGIQRHCCAPQTAVICAWGEQGASARASIDGPLLVQPAFALEEPVVDTLGAGDCFIGTALHHLSAGDPLERVLASAVRVSGKKCTQKGLLGL